MEKEITINGFLNNGKTKGTIIIDKNGMRIENKTPKYEKDSAFIHEFISNCINMDSWKHSWHLDVSRAQYKYMKEGKEVRKKIRKILLDKIENRQKEIQTLKYAVQVLGKWS